MYKPKLELGLNPVKVKKILIIYWGCFGDLVESEPFFRGLRQRFKYSHIDALVADWHNYGFHTPRTLAANNLFDRVFDTHPGIFISMVKSAPYDLVIDFFDNPRSQYLRRFSGSGSIIAAKFRSTPKYFQVFTLDQDLRCLSGVKRRIAIENVRKIPIAKNCRTKQMLEIGKFLGFLKSSLIPKLKVTEGERRKAKKLVGRRLVKKGKLIVLHPFGKEFDGTRFRLWPQGCYKELCRRLDEKGCRMVFVGSPEEFEKTKQLQKEIGCGFAVCFKDIRDYLGLMSIADLFISGDHGPLHMAMAAGTRSIGILYRPAVAKYWYDIPNRPNLSPMLLNHWMSNLSQVDIVWKEAVKILNK
jgi:ADP-heptose:LPS heptosyltransferase